MRLLLTGATGFVGRNFLLKALESGLYTEIVAPVRDPNKLHQQLETEGVERGGCVVTAVKASASDWKLGALPPLDHVVHLAGTLFARSREEYFQTNVQGTLNLLQALPTGGPTRVLILSSQSAAGPCGQGEVAKEESQTDRPVTWYGESKLEMERQVAREFSHLDYLILRPPMILGPRDQATLPLFKMARGPIQFKPGRRSKWYSFIAVEDLVSAMQVALLSDRSWSELGQRHFFVASNEPISDRALIETARKSQARRGVLLNIPQPFLKVASQLVDRIPPFREALPLLSRDRAREIWPDRWVVSSHAFQRAFPWQPSADLASTLSTTRDWYIKSGQLPV